MFQQWRTNSIDSQTVAPHHYHPMSHSPAHFRLMYVCIVKASLVLSSCATLSPLQSPLGVGPPLGGRVGVARRAGRLVQCGRRATLAGSSARSGDGPGAVGGFWLRRSTLLCRAVRAEHLIGPPCRRRRRRWARRSSDCRAVRRPPCDAIVSERPAAARVIKIKDTDDEDRIWRLADSEARAPEREDRPNYVFWERGLLI